MGNAVNFQQVDPGRCMVVLMPGAKRARPCTVELGSCFQAPPDREGSYPVSLYTPAVSVALVTNGPVVHSARPQLMWKGF